MRYLVLSLVLLSPSVLAEPAIPTDDTATAQPVSQPVADNAEINAHSNVVPATAQVAVPAEFLSAPQYQPQPLKPDGPSPLYSLPTHW